MLVYLALKMISSQRTRLATALMGVVFALMLVNIQAGLFIGLLDKAGLLVDEAGADLWIGHKQMNNVDFPRDIPREWEHIPKRDPDVLWSQGCSIGPGQMTMPNGRFEMVLVVGFHRDHYRNHGMSCVEGSPGEMLQPDAVAIDQCEAYKLDFPELGETREISGSRVKVAAKTHGATSFLVTPYVFTTADHAREILGRSNQSCSYVLVKAKPGTDVAALKSRLQKNLPDAKVLTGHEYARVSKMYWLTRTGLGISFGASTLLGLIVGLVVAGQAIYSIALDRRTEFAAMKAMGAREGQLFAILFTQSAAISAIGCGVGLVLTMVLAHLGHTPTAPINLPFWLLLNTAIGLCLICTGACLLPYLQLRKVDPLVVLGS